MDEQQIQQEPSYTHSQVIIPDIIVYVRDNEDNLIAESSETKCYKHEQHKIILVTKNKTNENTKVDTITHLQKMKDNQNADTLILPTDIQKYDNCVYHSYTKYKTACDLLKENQKCDDDNCKICNADNNISCCVKIQNILSQYNINDVAFDHMYLLKCGYYYYDIK